MKSILIILAVLLSSFMKIHEPARNICGVWKGYYGTESEINSITIRINPNNKAEISCNYNDACLNTKGTYKLVGDTAIVITCIPADKKSPQVLLYGNVNRSSSFIDGEWDGGGTDGGSFYLQKQFSQPDL